MQIDCDEVDIQEKVAYVAESIFGIEEYPPKRENKIVFVLDDKETEEEPKTVLVGFPYSTDDEEEPDYHHTWRVFRPLDKKDHLFMLLDKMYERGFSYRIARQRSAKVFVVSVSSGDFLRIGEHEDMHTAAIIAAYDLLKRMEKVNEGR